MRRAIAGGCLSLTVLLCGVARAENGVFIDPSSPVAKEYAIPLEAARRQVDPKQNPSAPVLRGDRSAAPFGAGIARPVVRPHHERRVIRKHRARRTRRPVAGPKAVALKAAPLAIAHEGVPSRGVGGPLLVVGITAGVLALGALLGFGLGRRRLGP